MTPWPRAAPADSNEEIHVARGERALALQKEFRLGLATPVAKDTLMMFAY